MSQINDIFPGIKGAEWATYTYLRETDLDRRISSSEIAHFTTYNPDTIQAALRRLESYGVIERHRDSNGQSYQFRLLI
ncbi:MAG: hypothetical protein AAF485_05065 [Chloroflexota bacterium]